MYIYTHLHVCMMVQGIYISKIIPGGAAAATGRLRMGDRLLSGMPGRFTPLPIGLLLSDTLPSLVRICRLHVLPLCSILCEKNSFYFQSFKNIKYKLNQIFISFFHFCYFSCFAYCSFLSIFRFLICQFYYLVSFLSHASLTRTFSL